MTFWFEGLFINRVGLCHNELSNLAIFIKKPMGQSMPGTSFEHVFALECATMIGNWYNYEAHSPWLKLWRLSKIQNLNVAGAEGKILRYQKWPSLVLFLRTRLVRLISILKHRHPRLSGSCRMHRKETIRKFHYSAFLIESTTQNLS